MSVQDSAFSIFFPREDTALTWKRHLPTVCDSCGGDAPHTPSCTELSPVCYRAVLGRSRCYHLCARYSWIRGDSPDTWLQVKHTNLPTKASCCRTVTTCVSVHTGTPSGHAVTTVTKESSISTAGTEHSERDRSARPPPQGNNPHGPEENTRRSSLYLNRYLVAELNKLR